jgi:hypothetical protein
MTAPHDARRKAELARIVDIVTNALPEPWIDREALQADGVAIGKKAEGLVLLFQTESGLIRWTPPKPKALYDLAAEILDRELAEFRKSGGVDRFMAECRAAMEPKGGHGGARRQAG